MTHGLMGTKTLLQSSCLDIFRLEGVEVRLACVQAIRKMYWIRANETQGWVPEFTDEYESEDDNSMDEEGEVKKNGIKDENSDGEIVPESLFEDGELENNHVD
ncbi:hypothetical protein Tco_0372873, partial [Tanacetum coccineum]